MNGALPVAFGGRDRKRRGAWGVLHRHPISCDGKAEGQATLQNMRLLFSGDATILLPCGDVRRGDAEDARHRAYAAEQLKGYLRIPAALCIPRIAQAAGGFAYPSGHSWPGHKRRHSA